jgi:hypothetical protein
MPGVIRPGVRAHDLPAAIVAALAALVRDGFLELTFTE